MLLPNVYLPLLQLSMPFPPGGLVYDYRLDDGGVSKVGKGDEEEEEDKTKFKVTIIILL